jgi:hypothetical protein
MQLRPQKLSGVFGKRILRARLTETLVNAQARTDCAALDFFVTDLGGDPKQDSAGGT